MSRLFANRRNAFCLLLIAAALMMRALMPGGTMISAERGGELAITICNSDMMLVIPIKEKSPSTEDDDQQQPCALAGNALADTPPDLFMPLPQLAAATYDATRAAAISPDAPRFLPPATGPPLSA